MGTLVPKTRNYTVEEGDTPWDIARENYGDPTLWKDISDFNHLVDANRIIPGQPLNLPVVVRAPSPAAIPARASAVTGSAPSTIPELARIPAQLLFFPVLKLTPVESEKPLLECSVGGFDIKVTMKIETSLQPPYLATYFDLTIHSGKFTALRQTIAKKYYDAISEVTLTFDPEKKNFVELSFEFAVDQKDDKGRVFSSSHVKVGTSGCLTYTFEWVPFAGSLGDVEYEGNFSYEAEICRRNDATTALGLMKASWSVDHVRKKLSQMGVQLEADCGRVLQGVAARFPKAELPANALPSAVLRFLTTVVVVAAVSTA